LPTEISIESGNESLADVDHFLPHVLKEGREIANLDGIWNLVLACQEYDGSKSSRVPDSKYLERLDIRNNYLISSHDPLKETLLRQTGNSASHRRAFLRVSRQAAKDELIHTWAPREELGTTF